MTHVFLHIGAFKTGTSFIQRVLAGNRSMLAEHGVLFPGKSWADQVRSVSSLRRPSDEEGYEWADLVREIDQWKGPSAIVSMEFLSLAPADRAARVLKSLERHEVTVMLTVRDLSRVIPGQWQESVQNRSTWPYDTYVDGVMAGSSKSNPAGAHFWRRHDWPRILRTWGDSLPRSQVVVVTIPPPGSTPGLLWERMCSAWGLPPAEFDTSLRINESLGAASAELMRVVTERAKHVDAGPKTFRVLKKTLAKDILVQHRTAEPTLVFPPAHYDWLRRRSARLVGDMSGLDPTVVGDLADLIPQRPELSDLVTTQPESLPRDLYLETAAMALTALAQLLAGEEGLATTRRGHKTL